MKQLMYVVFSIVCLCSTTTFIEAQEIFVCTTSLPTNSYLNELEEVITYPVYQIETNFLEKCYLPVAADRYYVIYNLDGKHLVAQASIEGQPSFVWEEGTPNEDAKWMIGGGILLSPLGTHLFVDDLVQVFRMDWEKTYSSGKREIAGNFSENMLYSNIQQGSSKILAK